jgi:hypothetical protein
MVLCENIVKIKFLTRKNTTYNFPASIGDPESRLQKTIVFHFCF